jgi:hypothetical protein
MAQFDCHPEQASFAQRRIWARRANAFVACPEQAKRVEGRSPRGTKTHAWRASLLSLPAMILALATALTPAQAGEPKYIAGVSYFNPGTMGTPLTWSGGIVTYYTDQGNLSPIYPGPSADALVADSFSQWTSISTTAVSAVHAGQLAEDVNGNNVYQNPDGTITMPADIMPTAISTPVGITTEA